MLLKSDPAYIPGVIFCILHYSTYSLTHISLASLIMIVIIIIVIIDIIPTMRIFENVAI